MKKMAKYGRGLGREIYEAIIRGDIQQPFNVDDCRQYSLTRGWNVPESYLSVVLANSEVNREHSETYKNYFIRITKGRYHTNPNRP